MAVKVKRTKTKTPNIYFNESTKKYDVKYNYKEYEPISKKNVYKAKWIYNLQTLNEAKVELAKLKSNDGVIVDKDITLSDIHAIWEKEAVANGYSVITIKNTKDHLSMISQFLPLDTKLKNINEDTYNYLISELRNKKYSEETLHCLNSCFKKLMRMAYQRDYLKRDILKKVRTKKFKVQLEIDEFSPHLISKREFEQIDEYFKDNKFVRLGTDRYRKYRLLFNFLYYSGCRIGEALALRVKDLQITAYNDNVQVDFVDGLPKEVTSMILQARIRRVLLSINKIVRYGTKNHKNRIIPLPPKFSTMYTNYLMYLERQGIKYNENNRIFDFTQPNAMHMLKRAIEKTGIRNHTLHDFRHTFISNLVRLKMPISEIEQYSGDTQRTIFKRYSHATENSKTDLIKAQEQF